MKKSWILLLLGFFGGMNATFAVTKRTEGLTDWLGPALVAVAMMMVGVGVSRRIDRQRDDGA